MRLTGLWAYRPFALLWTGQTVSQLGSQVTLVALPLTAILALGATPVQVGILTAMGLLPAAAVGLLAGVWVAAPTAPDLVSVDPGHHDNVGAGG
jgi:hypothetical protein